MRRRLSGGATAEPPAGTDAPESLTRVTGRGFVWSFGGSLGQAIMGMASIVLLSRLLTPAEFGAAAAAALVVGLASVVSQVGVGPALVQRKTLSDAEVSAAFLFSMAMSLVLAALLFLLAPRFNALVGLPRDSSLLRLLSLSLLLAGLAAVPTGLLQRRLRFRAMMIVDLLAAGPGAIGVSLALALLGFGAFSLVWGSIASAFVMAVGYGWLARPPLTVMSPRRAWRNVRPLLRFGAAYSVSQLGNWLALNADNLVTANLLGPTALGVYSRAYRLLSEPANLIGGAADKVLFPALARVRSDEQRLRGAYLRATSLVALGAGPLSVLLCVLAPELVQVLMGGGWSEVVLPLQILAVVLVPRASYKISGSLTRATGAVVGGAWRQWLYAAEVLVACGLGARWGVTGVAVGASVAIVLHFLVMLHFSSRISRGLMSAVLLLYLRKHLPIALVVLAVTYATASFVRQVDSPVLTLLAAGVAGSLSALVCVVLLRRSFREELAVLSTVARRQRVAGAGTS
jgi:O-antigen/teichoic acid export membrane protein